MFLFFFSEMFADEKCSVLTSPTGIFAECHSQLPPDQYHAVSTLMIIKTNTFSSIDVTYVKMIFVGRPVFKEPVTVARMCKVACALH